MLARNACTIWYGYASTKPSSVISTCMAGGDASSPSDADPWWVKLERLLADVKIKTEEYSNERKQKSLAVGRLVAAYAVREKSKQQKRPRAKKDSDDEDSDEEGKQSSKVKKSKGIESDSPSDSDSPSGSDSPSDSDAE